MNHIESKNQYGISQLRSNMNLKTSNTLVMSSDIWLQVYISYFLNSVLIRNIPFDTFVKK